VTPSILFLFIKSTDEKTKNQICDYMIATVTFTLNLNKPSNIHLDILSNTIQLFNNGIYKNNVNKNLYCLLVFNQLQPLLKYL